MNILSWFQAYISNFKSENFIDIIIAIGIILFFTIISSGVAHIITKIVKKNIKKSEFKKNKIYRTVMMFVKILGIYLALIFLKDVLLISPQAIIIIKKIFRIFVIYTVALVFSEGITLESLKKIKGKEENDEMSTFLVKIIRGLIFIVAIFIVMLELGYDLSGLVTGIGLGSVVITLAAQNLAKDILGGIVIFTDKPFKVGDWIQFQNYEGTVEDITYRSTRIRTFDNSQVNIPNAIISNEPLINWSRIEKRRYKIDLGLQIETPLNKIKIVEEKIKTMLAEKDKIMDDSIIVRFDKITDSTINLLIYAYTDAVDYASFLAEKEDINYKIMKILESENAELAYDTKTIYVRK